MKALILYLFACGAPHYVVIVEDGKVYADFINNTKAQWTYLASVEERADGNIFIKKADPRYGCT